MKATREQTVDLYRKTRRLIGENDTMHQLLANRVAVSPSAEWAHKEIDESIASMLPQLREAVDDVHAACSGEMRAILLQAGDDLGFYASLCPSVAHAAVTTGRSLDLAAFAVRNSLRRGDAVTLPEVTATTTETAMARALQEEARVLATLGPPAAIEPVGSDWRKSPEWADAIQCLAGDSLRLVEALADEPEGLTYDEMVAAGIVADDLATASRYRKLASNINKEWRAGGVPFAIRSQTKRGGKRRIVRITDI